MHVQIKEPEGYVDKRKKKRDAADATDPANGETMVPKRRRRQNNATDEGRPRGASSITDFFASIGSDSGVDKNTDSGVDHKPFRDKPVQTAHAGASADGGSDRQVDVSGKESGKSKKHMGSTSEHAGVQPSVQAQRDVLAAAALRRLHATSRTDTANEHIGNGTGHATGTANQVADSDANCHATRPVKEDARDFFSQTSTSHNKAAEGGVASPATEIINLIDD